MSGEVVVHAVAADPVAFAQDLGIKMPVRLGVDGMVLAKFRRRPHWEVQRVDHQDPS
jgi:hypothetical protein